MKTTILFFILMNRILLWGQTATPPAAGDGSSGNPYQIATLNNLYWITAPDGVVPSPTQATRWAAYYIQTADIDASATSGWLSVGFWPPIGNATTQFSGSYDGQGHTISGLFCNNDQFKGLFGKTSGATIQNLGVTAVNIGGSIYVGGLIGACNSSTVSNFYSTGNVAGDGSTTYQNVGGLIGIIENNSTVSNCYSTAEAKTSYRAIGGFVADISSSIVNNCYSTGAILNSIGPKGGFVGSVSNATVNNCFWNTETSGLSYSAAGTGKTTQEMTTDAHTYPNFYTVAGWDFYGEATNGSDDIWNINAARNSGYPFLTWQYPADSPLPVELISFTASVNENIVTLNWQTAVEVNNYGFQVERTSALPSPYQGEGGEAGSGWEEVGFVNGHGNSNSTKQYSFTDNLTPTLDLTLTPTLYYRLKQIDNDGNFIYSNVVEVKVENIPTEFVLYQNYPNPFNPTTTINYSIPAIINHQSTIINHQSTIINLKVYDVLGNEVAVLVNEQKAPGNYKVEFDASRLSSGVYFYQLEAGGFNKVKKLVLTK